MIARRGVLALGAAASVGGCGFRPLYGTLASGGTVRPELAAIYVAVMYERQGQLLRQALQRRFEGTDASVAKRFELTGGLAVNAEGIGIQGDSSSTRVRLNASSTWTLRRLDVATTPVTNGVARAIDGYNINNQEYFAADLEQSAAIRRLADTVADQITQDLAVYFRAHPTTA